MHKIIPKEVKGIFRSLKNYFNYILLIIYLGASWLVFERGVSSSNQALFIDLPDRKAYIFGIVILPNQMYLLTGILIVAALGLFLVTSVFGRIWCGFSCPHTVFTDLFRKVENWLFGGRAERLKLQSGNSNSTNLMKLYLMHFLWILISFLFAFGWVCYFYGSRQLVADLFTLSVSQNGMIWLVGLTASTYFFAGFFREKMCTHVCPYGRFQSAMVDNHTLQVHYNDWRGEPRGSVKSGAEGHCIDCNQCVLVCPMDIDIRNGWQMACIGCGLCVDACNEVMEKVNRPKGLIAFESCETIDAKKQGMRPKIKLFTAKNIMFSVIISITVLLLTHSMLASEALNYSVVYAGAQQTTILVDGSMRSNLKLAVTNQTDNYIDIKLKASILHSEIKLGNSMEYVNAIIFTLSPFEEYHENLFVKYRKENMQNNAFFITLVDLANNKEYKLEVQSMESVR